MYLAITRNQSILQVSFGYLKAKPHPHYRKQGFNIRPFAIPFD
jgi:hypothetical protein